MISPLLAVKEAGKHKTELVIRYRLHYTSAELYLKHIDPLTMYSLR
jgi:hypothetical protein